MLRELGMNQRRAWVRCVPFVQMSGLLFETVTQRAVVEGVHHSEDRAKSNPIGWRDCATVKEFGSGICKYHESLRFSVWCLHFLIAAIQGRPYKPVFFQSLPRRNMLFFPPLAMIRFVCQCGLTVRNAGLEVQQTWSASRLLTFASCRDLDNLLGIGDPRLLKWGQRPHLLIRWIWCWQEKMCIKFCISEDSVQETEITTAISSMKWINFGIRYAIYYDDNVIAHSLA